MIWLARILPGAKPIMFIYDFRVDEAYRRKGYGEQALRAAEERAKALGAARQSPGLKLPSSTEGISQRRLADHTG